MAVAWALDGVIGQPVPLISPHDVAFVVIVLGVLITMTGAFGDPNLIVVGLVVSIAGLVGVLVEPGSTPLVLGATIPIVGFVLFYIYRYVEFPHGTSPDQTSSAASLVGQAGFVTEEVTPRAGEIKLDHGGFDPHYRCRTRSGTIPTGERAVVIAPGGGNVVTVAPADEVDVDALEPPRADDAGWKVVDDLRTYLHRLR